MAAWPVVGLFRVLRSAMSHSDPQRLAPLSWLQACCTRPTLMLRSFIGSHQHAGRQLHRGAVQAAMLFYQCPAVDRDNFARGKTALQSQQCSSVGGIVVGGHQDGVVHNQEIGVTRRQTLIILIMDGIWQGQGDQLIGLAAGASECLQFSLHGREGSEVSVVASITGAVGDDVGRAEACQHIDMTIGVITQKFTMRQPQHTLGTQCGGLPAAGPGVGYGEARLPGRSRSRHRRLAHR